MINNYLKKIKNHRHILYLSWKKHDNFVKTTMASMGHHTYPI